MTDTDQTTPRPGDFTGEWHPALLRSMVTLGRPLYKLWFRSEVRGLDRIPPGGALIVSNHSGGTTPPDVPVLWLDFFEKFGYDRAAVHPGPRPLVQGADHRLLTRMGMIRASRDNAVKALRAGAVVIVFPGGDNDALRPTWQQSTIDFAGRTGYVTTAIEAGVPIVPVVSIGGQETQLFLTRGKWLAKRLGLKRLTRSEQFSVTMGFPFRVSVGAFNLPLPSKIVTAGAGADRHHRRVRRKPRRCRGRCARSQGDAVGLGQFGRPASLPDHRVTAVTSPERSLSQRLDQVRESVRALRRARLVVGLRPDRYLRMGAAMAREGITNTVGIAVSAQRCPDRPALIDELGVLTYRELDMRANALAAALQQLPGGTPQMVGIMCRNHRGFVDALAATERIGADVLLLNTSFAGPALAEVVRRERPDVIVYDQEFSASVDRAVGEKPDTARIVAWTDDPADPTTTVETLIARHAGHRPVRSRRKSKVILLTSGTTGTPKGARRAAGGGGTEGRGDIGAAAMARRGNHRRGSTACFTRGGSAN